MTTLKQLRKKGFSVSEIGIFVLLFKIVGQAMLVLRDDCSFQIILLVEIISLKKAGW